MIHIGDGDSILFSLFHFMLEHCGKYGTSSWSDTNKANLVKQQFHDVICVISPARMALCAWNSRPPTESVTSLNFSLSNRLPKSSESLHSGTLNWIMLLCPDIFTLSATTLTYKCTTKSIQGRQMIEMKKEKTERKIFSKSDFFYVSIIMKSQV